MSLFIEKALAQVTPPASTEYTGGGIVQGIADITGGIGAGVLDPSLYNIIGKTLFTILNFIGLLAICVLVIAALYLLFDLGNDTQKDKAKKTVMYTIIGLVIILIANTIITFIVTAIL